MSKEPAKRELKQERSARTRVDILEAAITLFAKRGFLATTMADLARAIRMTPGALYWHFPTKEDLLLAAIEELHQRYLSGFVDLLDEHRGLSAREQLQAFTRGTHSFLGQHREYGIFFGMLAAEAADSNERVAEAIREKLGLYAKVLGGILRHGQKTGEFRQDVDTELAAHGVFGGYLGALMYQNLFRATLDYDSMAASLDRLLMDGALVRKAP
ncbi:TetR/AcrR family transcriptional regulator [Myxococcus sp. CA040A]|uniref:TetR/AcrR family transcriptional regulator n=1 Tax=Myxococcus sp. CA040A TaxID=2741738 RepID=UPI00157A87F5|nr:TetR family transcriptional regulator [Myxococcus sp. CA040A]NTX06285.1 TetR/AcrR family transcriptional regulator [Myxococcus sp. CA040A]